VKKEEGPRAQKILRAESVQKPTGEKVAFSAEAHRRVSYGTAYSLRPSATTLYYGMCCWRFYHELFTVWPLYFIIPVEWVILLLSPVFSRETGLKYGEGAEAGLETETGESGLALVKSFPRLLVCPSAFSRPIAIDNPMSPLSMLDPQFDHCEYQTSHAHDSLDDSPSSARSSGAV
jgi:hypothetical protein